MKFGMPHSFQDALLEAGIALVAIGIIAMLLISGAPQAGSLYESLSQSVAHAFVALFSGILIGVGITLVADCFILNLKSRALRAASTLIPAVLFAGMAIWSIASPKTDFWLIALFFSSLSASGAFILTGIIISLSGAAKSFLSSR